MRVFRDFLHVLAMLLARVRVCMHNHVFDSDLPYWSSERFASLINDAKSSPKRTLFAVFTVLTGVSTFFMLSRLYGAIFGFFMRVRAYVRIIARSCVLYVLPVND